MIYADNATTTRLSDAAFEKMLPFLKDHYGNASSQHSSGIKAKQAIQHARKQVAAAIGADTSEIIFTSGGSEGNSWVIQGVTQLFGSEQIHIITSSFEHHSVLNVCHAIEGRGCSVTYIPIDGSGRVSVQDIISAIRPNTKLVSIMLANNEIGTIQPIAELGKVLREKSILFHTDAVQAVGHISVNVKDLQVDFLTASAHKFNGPKGTGFVFCRSDIRLPQMVFGGGQEHGYRAGTEDVAGIVALGYALEESVANMPSVKKQLSSLVEKTISGLKSNILGILINCEGSERLPGMINVTFPDVDGEAMMHMLDLKGICVSTSSACNSGKDEPSHVLLALGISPEQARSSIRISYGRYNTMQEVDVILSEICNAYRKILSTRG